MADVLNRHFEWVEVTGGVSGVGKVSVERKGDDILVRTAPIRF